jgi:hypothetical protein
MASPYSANGFTGLGTMGYPMAEHLTQKLLPSAKLCVFDVAERPQQKLAATNQHRVLPALVPKTGRQLGVLQKSPSKQLEIWLINLKYPVHATRIIHVKCVYLKPQRGVLASAI